MNFFYPAAPMPRRQRLTRAFSLVEVTISLAIAGLGFVTLLGLLPHGMEMVRRTSELSVGSKIIQKISGEWQSISWKEVNWTGYGPKRYFNDEGVEVQKQELKGGSSPGLFAYACSVYVPDQNSESLLPSGSTSSADTYMRRVRICVVTTSNENFDFATAARGRLTECPVILAKMNE